MHASRLLPLNSISHHAVWYGSSTDRNRQLPSHLLLLCCTIMHTALFDNFLNLLCWKACSILGLLYRHLFTYLNDLSAACLRSIVPVVMQYVWHVLFQLFARHLTNFIIFKIKVLYIVSVNASKMATEKYKEMLYWQHLMVTTGRRKGDIRPYLWNPYVGTAGHNASPMTASHMCLRCESSILCCSCYNAHWCYGVLVYVRQPYPALSDFHVCRALKDSSVDRLLIESNENVIPAINIWTEQLDMEFFVDSARALEHSLEKRVALWRKLCWNTEKWHWYQYQYAVWSLIFLSFYSDFAIVRTS